jgi:hypothetical protein
MSLSPRDELMNRAREIHFRLWSHIFWQDCDSGPFVWYRLGKRYLSSETIERIMKSSKFDYDLFCTLVYTLDICPAIAIGVSLS